MSYVFLLVFLSTFEVAYICGVGLVPLVLRVGDFALKGGVLGGEGFGDTLPLVLKLNLLGDLLFEYLRALPEDGGVSGDGGVPG